MSQIGWGSHSAGAGEDHVKSYVTPVLGGAEDQDAKKKRFREIKCWSLRGASSKKWRMWKVLTIKDGISRSLRKVLIE